MIYMNLQRTCQTSVSEKKEVAAEVGKWRLFRPTVIVAVVAEKVCLFET